jgi:hypothetical protein
MVTHAGRQKISSGSKPTVWDGDSTFPRRGIGSKLVPSPPCGMVTFLGEAYVLYCPFVSPCSEPTVWDGDTQNLPFVPSPPCMVTWLSSVPSPPCGMATIAGQMLATVICFTFRAHRVGWRLCIYSNIPTTSSMSSVPSPPCGMETKSWVERLSGNSNFVLSPPCGMETDTRRTPHSQGQHRASLF